MVAISRRRTKALLLVIAAVMIGSSAAALPTAAAGTTAVNVRDYGAIGDGVRNDSAAVQRANDAVAKAGGGRVYFPAGTYVVSGVYLDSYVEFSGSEATLKHPNGYSSAIIYGRTRGTTGSIVQGSRNLRVADATGIFPGVPIAIRSAGERIVGQTTNDPYLYTYVQSISGNDVVVARSAQWSAMSTTVVVGSIGTSIRGLTFDGNQPKHQVTSSVVPIDLRLSRRAVISGCVVRNGLHGAIRLDFGSMENRIERNVLVDNGRPAQRLGAVVWLFRGATANTVRDNTIAGANYLGISVDDRTEGASDWDAPSNSNWITGNDIKIAPRYSNVGIYVIGSSSNRIENNVLRDVENGVSIETSTQGESGRPARNNSVTGNTLTHHTIGITVTGSQNRFSTNEISETPNPIVDRGSGNTYSS